MRPGHQANSSVGDQRPVDRAERLMWAITVGEGLLWLGFVVATYYVWLMLPVWVRTTAVVGLAGVAGVGLFRVYRFYARRQLSPPTSTVNLKITDEAEQLAEKHPGSKPISPSSAPPSKAHLVSG